MMHRFNENRPRREPSPLPRQEPPRVIRHPISSGTAFSLATDAEHYRDGKSAAEWMALAEEVERRESIEAAEKRAVEERRRAEERDREREQVLRHVRRYGL